MLNDHASNISFNFEESNESVCNQNGNDAHTIMDQTYVSDFVVQFHIYSHLSMVGDSGCRSSCTTVKSKQIKSYLLLKSNQINSYLNWSTFSSLNCTNCISFH